MYPEEELARRATFKNAFDTGTIELRVLQKESATILIPWQLFLLDAQKLENELAHIQKQRADKVTAKLIAKRKGIGDVTSKRIIDRLIRLQNFVSKNSVLPTNKFCGSLRGLNDRQAIERIITFFEIDVAALRAFNQKSRALAYLIGCVEHKNINISQGVLTNKLLPNWQVVDNKIYKNTSGFVIRDEKVPFVFLPSEINPDETDGRQIFTLVYLLIIIGLNEYDSFLEHDFTAKALTAKGTLGRIHRLTSELLLPSPVTDKLRGNQITIATRDELAARYKMTPTAVVVTLRRRGVISNEAYNSLLPAPYQPSQKSRSPGRTPRIDTSVRKFCGRHSFEQINSAIRRNLITSIQAQYLLFGAVNKKGYKQYRDRIKI
jgi:Zn-dependent peptidase ImmA (M78 family)